MKLFCSACERIAPAGAFRFDGSALHVRCARCGSEAALEVEGTAAAPPPATAAAAQSRVLPLRTVTDAVRLAAEAAKRGDPFEIPEDRCPKCISPRTEGATTCRHCGLAYVNFVPEDIAPSNELREAFVRAMAQWDDVALHDAAFLVAARNGELAQLGRLYRLRQAAAPVDPIAQRGLDEVLRRASAASEVLRTSVSLPEERERPLWHYALVVATGLVVMAMVFTVIQRAFGG